MKEIENRTFKRIVIGILITFAIAIIGSIIIGNLDKESAPIGCGDLYIVLMILFGIFGIMEILKYQKAVKKYKKKETDKARTTLNSEYTEVFLNYSDCIPPGRFNCKARINEKGKIEYQIQLDLNAEIEEYEKFLKFFHFDDNSR